jgi:hypothetical protein
MLLAIVGQAAPGELAHIGQRASETIEVEISIHYNQMHVRGHDHKLGRA